MSFRSRPGADTANVSIPLFLFCGILPWFLFTDTVLRNCSAITENKALITKTVLPAEILPIAITLSNLVNHAIGLVILFICLAIFATIPLSSLGVLVYLPMLVLFAQGLGWIVAGLQVFVRDTIQVLQIVLSVWFWVTPVMYTPDRLKNFEHAAMFSPMAIVVTGYRNSLLGLGATEFHANSRRRSNQCRRVCDWCAFLSSDEAGFRRRALRKTMRALIVVLALSQSLAAQPPARTAIDRALPPLQRSAAQFVANRSCFSCHHNALPILTLQMARERGFAIDPSVLSAIEDTTFAPLRATDALDQSIQAATLNDPTPNDSYLLMAAAAGRSGSESRDSRSRKTASRMAARWALGNFRLPAPSLQQPLHSHRHRNTSYRSLRATRATP